MPDHHIIDLVVQSDGTIDSKVRWNRSIPNLIEQFPDDVQRRVQSVFWLPDRYERQLLRQARGMPYFARATLQQLIYHQRAERLSRNRTHREKVKQLRAARRLARLESARRIWREVDKITGFLEKALGLAPAKAHVQATLNTEQVASHPLVAEELHNPEVSTSPPVYEEPLTITQRYARDHGAPRAVPNPALIRDRSR